MLSSYFFLVNISEKMWNRQRTNPYLLHCNWYASCDFCFMCNQPCMHLSQSEGHLSSPKHEGEQIATKQHIVARGQSMRTYRNTYCTSRYYMFTKAKEYIRILFVSKTDIYSGWGTHCCWCVLSHEMPWHGIIFSSRWWCHWIWGHIVWILWWLPKPVGVCNCWMGRLLHVVVRWRRRRGHHMRFGR